MGYMLPSGSGIRQWQGAGTGKRTLSASAMGTTESYRTMAPQKTDALQA